MRTRWIDSQIGRRFGALVVLRTVKTDRGHLAVVRCDCGTERTTEPGNLKAGRSRSCGCLKPEKSRVAATRHGHSAEPEFSVWVNMLARCQSPNHPVYPWYGARGVTVCERWLTYEIFLQDMGRRPTSRHSLDRIDNDGGYELSNCRWADRRMQMNNTRSNVVLEHDGRKATVAEWAREIGMTAATLRNRVQRGWSIAEALSRPTQVHAAPGTFNRQEYMRAYRERRKARVYREPLNVSRETQSRLA